MQIKYCSMRRFYSSQTKYYYYQEKHDIKDYYDPTSLVIALFDEARLQQIWDKICDVVDDNEFAVFYSALQIRLKSSYVDSNNTTRHSTIVFHIPLLYYTIPQKVSTASVDFRSVDIEKAHNEFVRSLSKELAEHFLDNCEFVPILERIAQNSGLDVEVAYNFSHSIHRHPGKFGFSATDLSKSVHTPGIIYRAKQANRFWQVDSVLYAKSDTHTERHYNVYSDFDDYHDDDDSKQLELVTTETRVITVKPIEEQENQITNRYNDNVKVAGTAVLVPTISILYRTEYTSNTLKLLLDTVLGKTKSTKPLIETKNLEVLASKLEQEPVIEDSELGQTDIEFDINYAKVPKYVRDRINKQHLPNYLQLVLASFANYIDEYILDGELIDKTIEYVKPEHIEEKQYPIGPRYTRGTGNEYKHPDITNIGIDDIDDFDGIDIVDPKY